MNSPGQLQSLRAAIARRSWFTTLSFVLVAGCASASSGSAVAQNPVALPQTRTTDPLALDTLSANYVPAGFGSLRLDDVTVRITLIGGLQVMAIPLDEQLIRLLSPDSYRALSQLKVSRRRAVEDVANRMRLQSYSLWSVTFYGIEQGEVRFSPQEFIVRNVGQDFRPIAVLPLTSGFGENRVMQHEKQQALYVFDGRLDINQPLTAQFGTNISTTNWQEVLRRVEQERTLVRSRAAAKSP